MIAIVIGLPLGVTITRRGRPRARSSFSARGALLFPLFLSSLPACSERADVVVGSKNFTESIILGEIVAQQLERVGLTVDRRLNLGGTFICHEAIVSGQIDVYVEYTGTAHAAILELPTEQDQTVVQGHLDSIYAERWGLVWTAPFGFNNTFAMLVRRADAERYGLESYSDVAPLAARWRPGFGYEFAERADGYEGLSRAYGFRFDRTAAVMDLGLIYRALAEGRVDVIAANSTDGQIASLGLVRLADDRGYFPPYDAVPVVRRQLLEAHLEVGEALNSLGGTIDEETMRRMNYLVDVERRSVREVAREFLAGRR
ncbi:MAG: glycine betaine ABC transporter substrate-binding protein [Gemmatimonadales bacterium]